MESSRLIVKYLEGQECAHFAKIIGNIGGSVNQGIRIVIDSIYLSVSGPKLTEINQHTVAAQVYLAADMLKESIDSFINADDWVKARKVAAELDSRFQCFFLYNSNFLIEVKSECYTELHFIVMKLT